MKKGTKEKMLILTGNYGDGHIQVAQAIQDAMQIDFIWNLSLLILWNGSILI